MAFIDPIDYDRFKRAVNLLADRITKLEATVYGAIPQPSKSVESKTVEVPSPAAPDEKPDDSRPSVFSKKKKK